MQGLGLRNSARAFGCRGFAHDTCLGCWRNGFKPEVRYNRAVVYQAAGRLTEAIEDLDFVVDATGDADALHLLETCRHAVSASQEG